MGGSEMLSLRPTKWSISYVTFLISVGNLTFSCLLRSKRLLHAMITSLQIYATDVCQYTLISAGGKKIIVPYFHGTKLYQHIGSHRNIHFHEEAEELVVKQIFKLFQDCDYYIEVLFLLQHFLYMLANFCNCLVTVFYNTWCSGLKNRHFWSHDLSMQTFSTQLQTGTVHMLVPESQIYLTVLMLFSWMGIARYVLYLETFYAYDCWYIVIVTCDMLHELWSISLF
jgi:hypothetical protein